MGDLFTAPAEAQQRRPREVPALDRAVAEGCTRLLARQLEGSPAADEIGPAISVLVDDLRGWGLGDGDAERVRVALDRCGRTLHRWPTPLAVREALPRRAEARALPKPPLTAEQKARNLALLRAACQRHGIPSRAERERFEQASRETRRAAEREAGRRNTRACPRCRAPTTNGNDQGWIACPACGHVETFNATSPEAVLREWDRENAEGGTG